MLQKTPLTRPQKIALLTLQGVLIALAAAGVLLPKAGVVVPAWLLLAAGLACLAGMLGVFAAARVARARFVLAFVGGVAAAVGLAWWVARL